MPSHRAPALPIAAAIALVAVLAARTPSRAEAEPTEAPPIHPPGASVETALQAAWAGFIRDDAKAMRAALDSIDRGCRRVGTDEAAVLPKNVVSLDRAFHAALDAAREFAGAGESSRSYDYLKWLPLGCRNCHVEAAKAGLPSPSSASHADSESPTPPSGSTP